MKRYLDNMSEWFVLQKKSIFDMIIEMKRKK